MAEQLEHLAPHSVEAEQSVLGAILLNPPSLFEVKGFLQADDFFLVRHAWAYEAMHTIQARNEAIDNISLADELKARGRLDEFGGLPYITYLINHTPGALYTETYGRIVERAAIRRRLLDASSWIAKVAHDEANSIEDTLAAADRAYRDATARRGKRGSDLIADIGLAHSARLEERCTLSKEGKLLGIPTGLTELDGLLGGLEKSWYYVLAGRPGMGKTALLLTILLHAARMGAVVGIMSLEMDRDRLFSRLIAMETGITTQQQRQGQMNHKEWGLYWEAQDRLTKLPILIDHTPSMTPDAMRALAYRWHGEHGLQLALIDYIGLMSSPDVRPDDLTGLTTTCSRRAAAMCKELEIPVIMASQLNRDVEKRPKKQPILSDLKQSGSLEEDADVVMLMYRDEYYNPNTDRIGQVDIHVAKHRDGPTGTPTAFFRAERTQLSDLVKKTVNLSQFGDTESNALSKAVAKTRTRRDTDAAR